MCPATILVRASMIPRLDYCSSLLKGLPISVHAPQLSIQVSVNWVAISSPLGTFGNICRPFRIVTTGEGDATSI